VQKINFFWGGSIIAFGDIVPSGISGTIFVFLHKTFIDMTATKIKDTNRAKRDKNQNDGTPVWGIITYSRPGDDHGMV
jgi:uncharacterized membrane protein